MQLVQQEHHKLHQSGSNIFKDFMYYCRENCVALVVLCLLIALTYQFKLVNTDMTVDANRALIDTAKNYRWQSALGRNGLFLTDALLGTTQLIPGFQNTLMVLCLALSGVVWAYLLWFVRGSKAKDSFAWIFGSLFAASIPVLENLSFMHQAYQTAWAMVLLGLAFIFAWRFIFFSSWISFVASLVLGAWAFSSFQSLVTTGASAFLLTLLLYVLSNKEEKPVKTGVVAFARLALFFICAFVLSSLINNACNAYFAPEDTSYLSGQILWGQAAVSDIVRGIAIHVKDVVLARGLYSFLYTLGAVVFVVVALIKGLRQHKDALFRVCVVVLILAFVASPFFLDVVTGNGAVALRSQWALSFVSAASLACAVMYVDELLQRRLGRASFNQSIPVFRAVLVCLMGLVTLRFAVVPANRLLYTDHMVKQQEYDVTQALYRDVIAAQNGQSLPVVFVGQWHPSYNQSMARGEVLGESFYERSRTDICLYWQSLGLDVTNVSDEEAAICQKKAHDIPTWPQQGSIVKDGSYIIVHLSNEY